MVRSTNAGCLVYSSSCVVQANPATVEVILRPGVAGSFSGLILNSCNGTEQTVAVSGSLFESCESRTADTISVMVLYTQDLPNYLRNSTNTTIPRTVPLYLRDLNAISPTIFANSGVNNVAIRIVNPDGEMFTFAEIGAPDNDFYNYKESNIAGLVQEFMRTNPTSRISRLRDQLQADVVCVMGWGTTSQAFLATRDTLAGTQKDNAFIFFGAAGPPDSYVFQHEIGHLCLGMHEPGACTGYGAIYPDGQGFFDGSYTCTGEGPDARSDGDGVGTVMFHGYRTPNMTRIPYWSNPNITYTDTRRNRTFRIGSPTQNMSRVMSVSARNLANIYPNTSNVVIIGPESVQGGSTTVYLANPCSGGPYTFEWTVVRPSGVAIGPVRGNTFSLFMPTSLAGVTLRLIGRNAQGQSFQQILFVENATYRPALPFPVVAFEADPKNSTQVSSAPISNTIFGQTNPGDKPPLFAEEPTKLMLEQNHPNPFADETEIAYTLDNDAAVLLTLHDAFGRTVMVIDESPSRRADRYSFVVKAEGLPSGVYWYRLRAGDRIQTKSCVILK